MKKTIFAAMLLLPGLLLAQKVPIDDAGLGKLFPDCLLSGSICHLFPKDGDARDANACAIKKGDHAFDLEIRKVTFSIEKQKAMLGKPLSEIRPGETVSFHLEQDFLTDTVFLQALSIDLNFRTIPAGTYPVVITEEFVTIHLTLTD